MIKFLSIITASKSCITTIPSSVWDSEIWHVRLSAKSASFVGPHNSALLITGSPIIEPTFEIFFVYIGFDMHFIQNGIDIHTNIGV